MGAFNFFGEREHRVFNYRPVYYDEEQEALKQQFGKVDGRKDREAEQKGYSPGSYIKGSFRDGNYSRKRSSGSTTQIIVVLAGLACLAVAMYLMADMFPGILKG